MLVWCPEYQVFMPFPVYAALRLWEEASIILVRASLGMSASGQMPDPLFLE